jgi:hypothetical protein
LIALGDKIGATLSQSQLALRIELAAEVAVELCDALREGVVLALQLLELGFPMLLPDVRTASSDTSRASRTSNSSKSSTSRR